MLLRGNKVGKTHLKGSHLAFQLGSAIYLTGASHLSSLHFSLIISQVGVILLMFGESSGLKDAIYVIACKTNIWY